MILFFDVSKIDLGRNWVNILNTTIDKENKNELPLKTNFLNKVQKNNNLKGEFDSLKTQHKKNENLFKQPTYLDVLKIQNKNDNITTKPNDEINEDKSLFNISLNKSKETKEEILPIKTEVDEINILKPNIIPEKEQSF